MTESGRRSQAARGRLARLVVALAVLAGLGLAVGLQCTDGMATGMTMAMPMAHGANSAGTVRDCGSSAAMTASHVSERVAPAETSQLTVPCAAPGAAGAFILVEGDAPGSGGLGGVLATCLAFILAVVAAVVALRPGHVRSIVRMLRPVRVVVIRAIRPRSPSLAELCVLRT
ncbi:hypothetical protein [Actinokineospora sp. NPDC004072]